MKRRNVLKKIAASLLMTTLLFSMAGETAKAEELPYDTYNYSYWEDIALTPAAYVPNGAVTGAKAGTENFNEPQDLCVAPDGLVYVADTKNNRIVVLNDTMTETDKAIHSTHPTVCAYRKICSSMWRIPTTSGSSC